MAVNSDGFVEQIFMGRSNSLIIDLGQKSFLAITLVWYQYIVKPIPHDRGL